MTKKSYARQQRDLSEGKTKSAQKMRDDYFKKNTGWDDCNDLYQAAAEMIVGSGETVRHAFSDKNVFGFFIEHEVIEVNTAITGMDRDLHIFTTELLDIRKLHNGRLGAVGSEDDFNIILELGQKYSDFTTRFTAVVEPNLKFLMDKLGVALQRKEESEKAAKIASETPTE